MRQAVLLAAVAGCHANAGSSGVENVAADVAGVVYVEAHPIVAAGSFMLDGQRIEVAYDVAAQETHFRIDDRPVPFETLSSRNCPMAVTCDKETDLSVRFLPDLSLERVTAFRWRGERHLWFVGIHGHCTGIGCNLRFHVLVDESGATVGLATYRVEEDDLSISEHDGRLLVTLHTEGGPSETTVTQRLEGATLATLAMTPAAAP